MEYCLIEISSCFRLYGDFVNAVPFGAGHINSTYQVTFNQSGVPVSYIFQKINNEIFKDPYAVMDNIDRVLNHQKNKLGSVSDISRRVLTLIPTVNNELLYRDNADNYWRVYCCIENITCYDVLETPEQAYKAAKAFGEFQKILVDLPGKRLIDTIPDFHNTPKRYTAFEKAVAEDIGNRAKDVKDEIDFIFSRKKYLKKFIKLQESGELPERICHNDTKLNNIMIDNETGEGICVIDLDIVMPGFVMYDFGDMIRTGTSPVEEDEPDSSKVTMQMHLFKALAKGYLSSAGDFLTKAEKNNLVFGGLLITYEQAMRFLADHLQMDTYYKINRKGHNLDRTRTQIALIKSIEKQMNAMNSYIDSI
jgi:hypothetical protein